MKLHTALVASITIMFCMNAHAVESISFSKSIYANSTLPFESHRGNAPVSDSVGDEHSVYAS